MPGPIGLEKLSDIGNQGVVGVGIGEKGTDRQQDLTDGQRWAPLVLEDVQTDPTVRVDVAVVNACGKVNFWGLSDNGSRWVRDRANGPEIP